MRFTRSLPARPIAASLLLAAAPCLLAGCELRSLRTFGGESIWVTTGEGGDVSVSILSEDHALSLRTDGPATFLDDESDVASLAPGGRFVLEETLDGVEHEYEVQADRSGALTRRYSRAGASLPLDETARRWRAEALQRLFRESAFDADARTGRLLARGGPDAVLNELEHVRGEHARATYLSALFAAAQLDGARLARAFTLAASIDSDYELRRALRAALASQALDDPRLAALLETTAGLGSDYERSQLLMEAAPSLGAGALARAAWLGSARSITSDYELRRSLEAALAQDGGDSAWTAVLVGLAGERMGSDHELRTLLGGVAARGADPRLAAAYLAACRELGSDYERRTALIALVRGSALAREHLLGVLDATAEMRSDFEKGRVLEVLAPAAAQAPELEGRFREVAQGMGKHERGEALRALDDALRRQ